MDFKERYIKTGGTKCLVCERGDGFDCGSIEIDGVGACQECHCINCGSSWTDYYTLTDVFNVNVVAPSDDLNKAFKDR